MSTIEDAMLVAERLKPADRLLLIERLWESLPQDAWPAANDNGMTALRRRAVEFGAERDDSVPWPIVERLLADCAKSSQPKIYSAPRRFDLATIFIVTLAYSLLFGAMSALKFPPVASLIVAGFITLVGVSQALLFGGRRPRLASVVVGALVCALSVLGYWLVEGRRAYATSAFIYSGMLTVIGGAILGYLAGTIVGGIFLFAEIVRWMLPSRSGAGRGPNREVD